MRKKIIKYVSFLILIIVSLTLKINIVKAEDSLCELSDEYLKWLDLSSEEQAKTIMPNMCKNSDTNTYTLMTDYSLIGSSYGDTKYNLLDSGYVTAVKNQKQTSSCWAFSANAMLESYMLKRYGISYDLSERHMEYYDSYSFNGAVNSNGYYRAVGSGGNIFMASSYYINGYGPIIESDMPFENNENQINISEINNKTTAIDVNDIDIVSSTDDCSSMKTIIKKYLIDYGAVATSMYIDTDNYYNSSTKAYFYDDGNISNHGVTIVGWDDNYSKTNFLSSNQPSSNGAWIVKNSYGTSFGNNGYMYISYNDSIICDTIGAITDADTEEPDNTYFYDKLSVNGGYGNATDKIGYVTNVFTKDSNTEALTEVVIGTRIASDYVIYVNQNNSSLDSSEYVEVASGTINSAGYHTIKLSNPLLLNGTNFAIRVKYTSDSGYAIPISIYQEATPYQNVSATNNVTFGSSDGTNWYDLYEREKAIAPVKANTEDVVYDLSTTANLDNVVINNVTGGTYNIPITSSDIPNNSNLNVVILNSNNQDVTSNFTINGKTINNNQTTLNITVPSNSSIAVGSYKALISYEYKTIEITFNVYEYKKINLISSNEPDKIITGKNYTITYQFSASGITNNSVVSNVIQSTEDISNISVSTTNVSNNRFTSTVNINSNITAGQYNIIYTVDGTSYTKEINIINYIAVTKVSFPVSSKHIKKNQTFDFAATIKPTDATIKDVTYISSNQSVATIDESGKVTTISRGTTTLSAKSNDNDITGTSTITVIDPSINIESTTISGNASSNTSKLYLGYGGTVTYNINYQDITTHDDLLDMSIAIYSSTGALLSPSDYSVNIIKVSDTSAKIILSGFTTSSVAEYKVQIVGKYLIGDAKSTVGTTTIYGNFYINSPVKASSISADTISLYTDETKTINYQIYPFDTTNKSVTFASTDTNIFIVDMNGKIIPKSQGSANLRITCQDASGVSALIKITAIDRIFASTPYSPVDNVITSVTEKTSYQTFMNNLNKTGNPTLEIYFNGSKVNSGYIGTGMQLVKNNNIVYEIVVNGDVSGDGMIKSNDALLIERKLVGLTSLKNSQQKAADVSKDNKLGSNDSLIIKRFLINLSSL